MSERDSTVPLAQEELSVSTRSVVTGRVRIETRTDVVNELVRVPLETSEVEVERVTVGREVDHVPEVRTAGDVTIVPVMEEILVVEKRLFLKEELHIKRRVTTETTEAEVPVRKQQAVIHREGRDAFDQSEESNDD
jgi:uncharacterized protein (TIGR02271 family)